MQGWQQGSQMMNAYLGRVQKKEIELAKQEAEAEENKVKNMQEFHKKGKNTAPKNSPDWHHHNYILMRIDNEKVASVDPSVEPLSIGKYSEQFVNYKPEDYENWKGFTRSQYREFHPSENEIKEGRAFVEFQKTKIAKEGAESEQVTYGEELEEDTKSDLKRLEKIRQAAERWTSIVSKDKAAMESFGLDSSDLNNLEKMNTVKDILKGKEDIPVMTLDEFKSLGLDTQYKRRIAQYNLAQQEQGSKLTYEDISPFGEDKMKELGLDAIVTPESEYASQIDSLSNVLTELESKYPNIDFTKKITEEEL